MTTKAGSLSPRPYARLISMLGEQLIKDNSVALTELAKNAYDADAEWIQIRIGNMANYGKENVSSKDKPYIEIEDSGDGMSFNTIKDSWMNPAAPNKYIEKKEGKGITRKGRIIQGEKGIGRYAIFQIGKKVIINTRERLDENQGGEEICLTTDLTKYSEELLTVLNKKDSITPVYFDQISSKYIIRDKPVIIKTGPIIIEGKKTKRKNHGTLIRITELNYEWKYSDVIKIRRKLSDLQSPFGKIDFDVSILFDGEEIYIPESGIGFEDALNEATLTIEGSVNSQGICSFTLNDKDGTIDFIENLTKDKVKENRLHFFDHKLNKIHSPECGPFTFKYYVFNLQQILNKKMQHYIRNHRIYIYRDEIRVYPYGDKDNDWIKLDIYRGIHKAGFYLSNDQVIGFVNISSEKNFRLRDKTNREGLLEQGTAYEDLRLLNLSILNYLNIQYQKTKIPRRPKQRRERKNRLYIQTELVKKYLDALAKYFDKIEDIDGVNLLKKLAKEYYKEIEVYKNQINLIEDLAGVGIAVDAASHDVMVVMNRALENIQTINSIIKNGTPDLQILTKKISHLNTQIQLANDLLNGIQPIFRSARRKNKNNRIAEIVLKVKGYYQEPLKKSGIKIHINEIGSPLILKNSSEGVLLQLFINLLDNALYWLIQSRTSEPKVDVLINGNDGIVIFADNGPGVDPEDIDYIFEPFFSTKGLEARGLGLYIARQLTDNYDYEFYYLENVKEKILPGANFKIEFVKKQE